MNKKNEFVGRYTHYITKLNNIYNNATLRSNFKICTYLRRKVFEMTFTILPSFGQISKYVTKYYI